jgi:hypothetical protein
MLLGSVLKVVDPNGSKWVGMYNYFVLDGEGATQQWKMLLRWVSD